MTSVNSIALSTCFFTTLISLFLTSCQPKDIDLRAMQTANQFTREQKVSSMGYAEVNNLLALTVERAFEPLQLLKAKLDADFANQQDLQIEVSPRISDSDELPEELIETKKAVKEKKLNRKTNTTSALSYKVDEFSVDAGGKLRKLVLIKNIFKKTTLVSVKQNGDTKPSDFRSESVSEKMTIRPSADENVYVIKVSRSDSTDSKKDKKTLIQTETKIKIIWDGQKESLRQPLPVIQIELKSDRLLNKTGGFHFIDSQPKSFSVELGACISIHGTMMLNKVIAQDQKMTNPEQIVISDSSFVFSSKQVSQALPCETRPVVDLARML